MKLWKATSYGAGKRHWYVTRASETLEDSRGNYRRWERRESAQRVADALNAELPLTAEERAKIDRAWELHKASGPHAG